MPRKSTAYAGKCPYCEQEFTYVEYHIRDRCEATPVVVARIIAPEFFKVRKPLPGQATELIEQVAELINRVRLRTDKDPV